MHDALFAYLAAHPYVDAVYLGLGSIGLVFVFEYTIIWFATEIHKSCRIWRGNWRARITAKRDVAAQRDERRHLIGCDL
jgi:hypothetical protein